MKRVVVFLFVVLLSFNLFAETIEIDDEFIESLTKALEEHGYVLTKKNDKNWWKSEAETASFIIDLFGRATMLRKDTFAVGGGLNLGLETESFQFAVYGLGDYFLSPIGGSGGAASLEYMAEGGVMFSWKLAQAWISRSYVAIDVGYFMQYAKIPQDTTRIFLANNGIMFRPKFYTLLQIGKHYNVSIGLYYQIPVYPKYEDYKGIGAYISIL